VVPLDVVEDYAAQNDACARPLLRQVTDRETGQTQRVVIACGATRESMCASCAEKARRLRMQQCMDGWHLDEDPLRGSADDEPGDDSEIDTMPKKVRRVRSTRRRGDVVDLPRLPVEDRSVGQTFMAPDGTTYRPSMFVTLTLGSYGKVVAGKPGRQVRDAGCPVDAGRYDYRRAAIEAMFFTRLFDRWMQNLRRCAGFRVQYFGAIEPQRRLAPHIHLAIRGAIPRRVLRAVTAATYLQLWWPSFDTPVYVDESPRWDRRNRTYRDPDGGVALPTWEEALDALDANADAQPAVVMRFGRQVDIKGIIAPSEDANRSVRYLTKYLTKAVAETYVDPDRPADGYEAHIDRLHAELRFLPCSPECANWLRYGVQPKDPEPGLRPGWCASKAHDREHLGVGGRRVQVSRHWSGKTLKEHKADRAAVVREVLAEAGVEVPDTDRMASSALAADGKPRFLWEDLRASAADYAHQVLASIVEARRWRRQYAEAKWRVSQPGSRAGPVETNSATTQEPSTTTATTAPRPPDSQPHQVA
jgi:hypothetical protein